MEITEEDFEVRARGFAPHYEAIPNYYSGVLVTPSGGYSIRPILLFDREDMKNFLCTTSDPFYRNGKPYSVEESAERIDKCIQRHLQGNPFSMYIIYYQNLELGYSHFAGYYTIGLDKEGLHLGMLLKEKYRHQGIATAAWAWTKDFLREMAQRDVRVHGKPLADVKIQVLAHPENQAMIQALEKAGFQFQKSIHRNDFDGVHTGDRNVYEFPVQKLLENPS